MLVALADRVVGADRPILLGPEVEGGPVEVPADGEFVPAQWGQHLVDELVGGERLERRQVLAGEGDAPDARRHRRHPPNLSEVGPSPAQGSPAVAAL